MDTKNEAAMGFITPELSDVDRYTWQTKARALRLQVVTRYRVEQGVCRTLCAVYLLYLLKVVV
ncbi:DUF3556 domain-containing protein [Mycobacterium uberis]|uniref:DUF3556 domain-containing protein n=1 Tax=Mycobacterium uberis TaxID=2162698 RepID=UPI0024372092|nr:DUF3556 domain-containing protein [Mycobacterium uberis]